MSSSALALALFLPYKMFHEKMFYSSLYLVILHQNPFTTVTYFLTISYRASTKLANKT